MKRIVYLLSLLSLCASCVFAHDSQQTPDAQQQTSRNSVQEVVYEENEVDVRARRKDEPKAIKKFPSYAGGRTPFTHGCPAKGTATLRFIINESGKVAEITIVNGSSCANFDRSVAQDLRKLKFTPALKGGQAVSQWTEIKFSYVWPIGRG